MPEIDPYLLIPDGVIGILWHPHVGIGRCIAATDAVDQADLGDRAATDRMLAEVAAIGRVDVLVNNAGIAESASLDRTSDALWDRILELDATAPFRITRALVPPMVAAGWGRIVNVASNAAFHRTWDDLSGFDRSAYMASKAAVIQLTRSIAVTYGRKGVRANCIGPGGFTRAFGLDPDLLVIGNALRLRRWRLKN